MDELMLDGNAVAGLLQAVFAVDMTTAVGTCGGCGAAGPDGAVQVYRTRARDYPGRKRAHKAALRARAETS